MVKEWKPHKIEDIDKGVKFPDKKVCPRHGIFYGEFCLRCRVEGRSGLDWNSLRREKGEPK